MAQPHFHSRPPLTKCRCPLADLFIGVKDEEGSWAIAGCAHGKARKADLSQPIVDLCVMTTCAKCVVMVDHSTPTRGEGTDFLKGHLLSKLRGPLPPFLIVDDPVVRIRKDKIAARQPIKDVRKPVPSPNSSRLCQNTSRVDAFIG